MELNRKGFIRSASEVAQAKPPDELMVVDKNGQIQTVKIKGLPKLLQVYPLLRPSAECMKLQEESSIHTWVTMERIGPGDSLDEHYHECNANMPVFDHIFYVISGRVRVTIGDIEETVGADTLIYCPSNIRHSMINVGNRPAKYLKIGGAGEGEKMGGPIYTKMPK